MYIEYLSMKLYISTNFVIFKWCMLEEISTELIYLLARGCAPFNAWLLQ
jgi:hypothetical protein